MFQASVISYSINAHQSIDNRVTFVSIVSLIEHRSLDDEPDIQSYLGFIYESPHITTVATAAGEWQEERQKAAAYLLDMEWPSVLVKGTLCKSSTTFKLEASKKIRRRK